MFKNWWYSQAKPLKKTSTGGWGKKEKKNKKKQFGMTVLIYDLLQSNFKEMALVFISWWFCLFKNVRLSWPCPSPCQTWTGSWWSWLEEEEGQQLQDQVRITCVDDPKHYNWVKHFYFDSKFTCLCLEIAILGISKLIFIIKPASKAEIQSRGRCSDMNLLNLNATDGQSLIGFLGSDLDRQSV